MGLTRAPHWRQLPRRAELRARARGTARAGGGLRGAGGVRRLALPPPAPPLAAAWGA